MSSPWVEMDIKKAREKEVQLKRGAQDRGVAADFTEWATDNSRVRCADSVGRHSVIPSARTKLPCLA